MDLYSRLLINHGLMRMAETGELQRIVGKYTMAKPQCGGTKGHSLGFSTVGLAFVVFLCGPIASMIVLVSGIDHLNSIFIYPFSEILRSRVCRTQENFTSQTRVLAFFVFGSSLIILWYTLHFM